jgi:hypothetical protein
VSRCIKSSLNRNHFVPEKLPRTPLFVNIATAETVLLPDKERHGWPQTLNTVGKRPCDTCEKSFATEKQLAAREHPWTANSEPNEILSGGGWRYALRYIGNLVLNLSFLVLHLSLKLLELAVNLSHALLVALLKLLKISIGALLKITAQLLPALRGKHQASDSAQSQADEEK